MEVITDNERLEQLKQQSEALLILFGGRECNVCHAIKPKIEEALAEHFPKMERVYVDCHETTDICSQNGVLSLPTVQVYFTGQRFIELVRTFSVGQLMGQIERPYHMLFNEV
jgi:thioredoxin-like negative regulator of GroEL